VNGNVKLGRAAARSGEWAQHFSNASCFLLVSCSYAVVGIMVLLTSSTAYNGYGVAWFISGEFYVRHIS